MARHLDADDDAMAVNYRTLGLGYRQIAEKLDCSISTAHAAVHRSLAANPVLEAVEDLRLIEAARLDTLWRAVAKEAVHGHVPSVLAAVRVHEARARLLGLADDPLRDDAWQVRIIDLPAELQPASADEPLPVDLQGAVTPPPDRQESPDRRAALDRLLHAEEPVAWSPPWKYTNGSAGP